MSFKTLETAVLAEARTVLKRPKLRHKDILEWSTSEVGVRKNLEPSEVATHLPHLNVWIATKGTPLADPRKDDCGRPLA